MTDAMRAETISFSGYGGDEIEGYLAHPLAEGTFGAVIVVHHMPGYDEGTKELTRKFAHHRYLALCPNLYHRHAAGASPDDAAAAARALGGVDDEQFIGDAAGAASFLRTMPSSNGKVGIIGYCSGGRQAFLAACTVPVDAAVDCYGAFVVGSPPEGMVVKATPIVHLVKDLRCPLLGLFGAEDQYPSPEQTAELEKALIDAGKTFEFHTYEGAGHAFFNTERPSYRPEAANEGWREIWDFYGRYLISAGQGATAGMK